MAEQEQGFKVTDRRSSTAATTEPEQQQHAVPQDQKPEPEPQAEGPKTEPQASTEETGQEIPLPEANLLTLIFSLYTHAQICLGILPDPVSQMPQKDLKQAKYNIDLLGVLQQKTKGNLSTEEEQTLENVLYELRMTYVSANK